MTFYCPRGHAQHYLGESEETKLRRERDQLKQRQAYLEDQRREANERAEHEAARARGYKGHAAKLTKRIKAGVCPCCRRSFGNLQRHMTAEHPAFGASFEGDSDTSHSALVAAKPESSDSRGGVVR